MVQTIPFLVSNQNHLIFHKQTKKIQDQKYTFRHHTRSTPPSPSYSKYNIHHIPLLGEASLIQ